MFSGQEPGQGVPAIMRAFGAVSMLNEEISHQRAQIQIIIHNEESWRSVHNPFYRK